MAYVDMPKDIARVKSKLVLGLTGRQLICFPVGAAFGIPTLLFTKGVLGNTLATVLMMAVMAPFFLLGVYEKDGLPAEKLFKLYLRARFFYPPVRVYQASNLYQYLEQEERSQDDKTNVRRKGHTSTAPRQAKPRKSAGA